VLNRPATSAMLKTTVQTLTTQNTGQK
jgi:hypothetical protein